jgi:TolB protein
LEGESSAKYIGEGNQAVWGPDGEAILASLRSPDQYFLTAYLVNANTYLLPPRALSGRLEGITWGPNQLSTTLPDDIRQAAAANPAAPWTVGLTPGPGAAYGRQYTLELPGVKAPTPALSALAVEPFLALRLRAQEETSWDVLSDLENAFVPLTAPLPAGRGNDWLYTGRAFALNRVLLNLDWMKVTREDFAGRTYWRVYLRPRNQDGSQGRPMTTFPWDFNARFSGNTTYYEEGGTFETTIPIGYWVDFTALALDYGWERQPALSNWRSFFQGARFNIFAITSGLDWEDAMLQLYPPEIFMEPLSPTTP